MDLFTLQDLKKAAGILTNTYIHVHNKHVHNVMLELATLYSSVCIGRVAAVWVVCIAVMGVVVSAAHILSQD